MKRVIIVHGWGGNPEEGWFPWVRRELEKQGFRVLIPGLPDTDNPRIGKWVSALTKVVGKPDKNTYFVGHSMGCQAIARYLETLPEGVQVGGVVFVAGFFKRLTGLEDDPKVRETDKHWLEAPINFEEIKSHLPKSIAVFSDNDSYVPLDNQDDFTKKLGSEIIIQHNMGHFSEDQGVIQLPIVLESILKLSQL